VRPPSPPHETGGGTRRLDPWAVGSARSLPATCDERPASPRRPARDRRHLLGAPDGCAVARPSGALRQGLDRREPLLSLAQGRGFGPGSSALFSTWPTPPANSTGPCTSSTARRCGRTSTPQGSRGAARPSPRPLPRALPRRVLDRAARARQAGREARDLRLDRRRAARTGGATRPPGRRCRQAPWSGPPRLRPDRIAGDRGYSSGAARDGLRRRGIGSVIPQPRNQRSWAMVDWSAYRERNKVERLSCRLEPLRGDLVRREADGAPAPSRARLRRRSCAARVARAWHRGAAGPLVEHLLAAPTPDPTNER
jgi:hypothetical protein